MKLKFHPSKGYARDTGLVAVLVLLLAAYWTGDLLWVAVSIGVLVVAMTVPAVLMPVARIWYYFSTALGMVTNRIILFAIYTGLLLPVGLIRRALGFDPMKRRMWKQGTGSVFVKRAHTFVAEDLSRPF